MESPGVSLLLPVLARATRLPGVHRIRAAVRVSAPEVSRLLANISWVARDILGLGPWLAATQPSEQPPIRTDNKYLLNGPMVVGIFYQGLKTSDVTLVNLLTELLLTITLRLCACEEVQGVIWQTPVVEVWELIEHSAPVRLVDF